MLDSIIIIDDYGYINGGAASVAISSAIYLADKTDYNVYFFSSVGPICSELENANLKEIICLDQNDILQNPSKTCAFIQGIWNETSNKKLGDFLNQFNPLTTIIHVHTWTKSLSSSIFNAIDEKGFKVVITLHDYFINCPNGGYFNYKKLESCELKPLSMKCFLCNCDSRHYYFKLWRFTRQIIQNKNILTKNNVSFIYISEFSKQQLLRRTTKLKSLYFVENPISFEGREKITAEENMIFLYVGRLSEEKGTKLFCEVAKDLNLKAIVIGDGPLREELNSKYGKKIQFTGWLDKISIQSYYRKTKCLIFTSLCYETLGLSVLEALSFGIPCLVPNNSSSSQLIKDEENGIIYRSGDKESLKKSIEKLENKNLVRDMSKKAFSSFNESQYNIENHKNSLISIYQSILDKSK